MPRRNQIPEELPENQDMLQDDGYVSHASHSSDDDNDADDQATLVNSQAEDLEHKQVPLKEAPLHIFGQYPLVDVALFYILMTTLNGASFSVAQSRSIFMGRPPLRLEWIALCLLSLHTLLKIQLVNSKMLLSHTVLMILCDTLVYRVLLKADEGRLAWLLPILANVTVYYHIFMLARGVSGGAAFGLVLLAVIATETFGSLHWWLEDDTNAYTSLSVLIPLHTVGYGIFSFQANLFEHIAQWRNEQCLRAESAQGNGLHGAKFRFFHHESSSAEKELCITEVTPSSVTLQLSASDLGGRLVKVNGLPWSEQIVKRLEDGSMSVQIDGLLHSTEYEIQLADMVTRVCTSAKENTQTEESIKVEAPADSIGHSSEEAELSRLENAVQMAENEKNELSARLKKLRKDEQKTEASLRSEVDALRRGLERSATTDHRAKQRVLALQEQVKQLSKRIDQGHAEVEQSTAGQQQVEQALIAVHNDWLKIREESDAHHAIANEKIAQDKNAMHELETALGVLISKHEKMQAKKQRLETIELPMSEKKLAELKQELMATTLQRRYAERQREGEYPKLPNPYLSTTNIEALDHAAEDMTQRITKLMELLDHETREIEAISAELEALRGRGVAKV